MDFHCGATVELLNHVFSSFGSISLISFHHLQQPHSGSTVEIHGNPWIFEYFSGFFGYFQDFWLNIKVFGPGEVGIA